jgi:hypothetical protein
MPTINDTYVTADVLHYEVDIIGTEAVVKLRSRETVGFIAPAPPNGVTSNDPTPVILHYINSKPEAQRPGLWADYGKGLVRVQRYQATPAPRPEPPDEDRALAQAQAQDQARQALVDAIGGA